MNEKPNIKVSVRNLIEFILRSGDIDNRSAGRNEVEAMHQGSRLHRKIQGRMKGNYTAEVPLKIEIPFETFDLTVEGRADGIENQYDTDGQVVAVTIDEIKCMYRDVTAIEQPDSMHLSQVKCYGYIYAVQQNLQEIALQLTYVNIETEEIKRIKEVWNIEQLKEWFFDVVGQYEKWVIYQVEHGKSRVDTAKKAQFPFQYRKGQKEIAVSVYKTIQQKRRLFIQAPTGVGKTMSVIFPAVKAVGENLADKIFYLTAKTITGTVAHDSFARLRSQGLDFKCISITAKEKMCVLEKKDCNPDVCPRAKGHFDRINEAIYDVLIHEDDITREVILKYAEKYQVCPYEMNLDISSFVDAIICDYNYAFDPVVALKRFFSAGNSERYLFLVDESHNLVERARNMYSADLSKEDFLKVKRMIGDKSKRVSGALERCNRTLLHYKRVCKEQEYVYIEEIGDFVMQLERLYGYFEKFFEDYREFEGKEEVLEFYFQVIHFLNMYDAASLYDEQDQSCYETCGHIQTDGDFYLRLMCINPSANLKERMEKAVSTIFFSATLLPVNYYKLLLSGDVEDYAIYIDSPFACNKRKLLMANDVSSKYTRRTETEYQKIATYIRRIVDGKKGNYMVFAPSYQYMNRILENLDGEYEIMAQQQSMDERQREEFLEAFDTQHEKTFLGFCVMGGLFSEGIDLTGERLIGSIIIGTGLPQICMEKEVVKQYFQKNGKDGFAFAYLYPGINKVLQAAGRVIRTHEDTGVIALLDERFHNAEYTMLFPREWQDYKSVNLGSVQTEIEDFWKGMGEKKEE